MNADVAAIQVADFLYRYHYENWMGVNPDHRPLTARTPSGLYALIRMATPALGEARDVLVAGVVRAAGYMVVPLDSGSYTVEKYSTPTA